MKYVIECEEILYGPFHIDRAAADWATRALFAAVAVALNPYIAGVSHQ